MLATVAVLALAAGSADAAPKRSKKKRAQTLANRAQKAYVAGNLERAEKLLRRAYQLDPDPVLIYNLARVLDSAGDLEGARTTYLRYLAMRPKAPDRKLIERRLTTLDDLARTQEGPPDGEALPPPAPASAASSGGAEEPAEGAAPPTLAAPIPPPPPPEPAAVAIAEAPVADGGVGLGPWVVLAAGGTAVVTGSVLGILSASKESSARDEPIQTRAAEIAAEGEDLALGGNIALGIGAAAVAAGVTWLLFSLN